MNPFPENTQKFRIMEYLRIHGEIELWRLIAPRPEGLGIAQYNARIKEMRETLEPKGWRIVNKAGKSFKLEPIPSTEQLSWEMPKPAWTPPDGFRDK